MNFSIDDNSKALLLGDEQESRELINCGKLPVDGIDNKAFHPPCTTFEDETVTQENAAEEIKPDVKGSKNVYQVPPNTEHDDVQQDKDFIAKDLLCFAWQIARGMVRTEQVLLTNRVKTKDYYVKKNSIGY